MTIEELIQDLERMREMFGPHIEVFKRRVKCSDGSVQFMPVKTVKVHESHSACPVVSI